MPRKKESSIRKFFTYDAKTNVSTCYCRVDNGKDENACKCKIALKVSLIFFTQIKTNKNNIYSKNFQF